MKPLNCAYCEIELTEKNKTTDHFIPRKKGGAYPDNHENLILSCRLCNSMKNAMSPQEFLAFLSTERISVMKNNIVLMMTLGAKTVGDKQRAIVKQNNLIRQIKRKEYHVLIKNGVKSLMDSNNVRTPDDDDIKFKIQEVIATYARLDGVFPYNLNQIFNELKHHFIKQFKQRSMEVQP